MSRTHAQLVRVGTRWYVEDDGLSRNGTWVNEERVTGGGRCATATSCGSGTRRCWCGSRRRGSSGPTRPESRFAAAGPLSARAAARAGGALPSVPGARAGPHPPASNEQIAGELHLSVDAVKAHLRQLFRRFDIEHLPQIQKRTALVRIAIEAGILRSGLGQVGRGHT